MKHIFIFLFLLIAFTSVAQRKLTLAPTGTKAGFNIGSRSGAPSGLVNGDGYYDTNDGSLTFILNGGTAYMTADFANFGRVYIGSGNSTNAGTIFIGNAGNTTALTADGNVGIGDGALTSIQDNSTNNIAIGSQAADNITTGISNVVIGNRIDAQLATGSNQLSIQNIIFGTGNGATGTAISTGNIGIGVVPTTAKLEVNQPTLGTAVRQITSTATNDDPITVEHQNRVATTDATVTTLHTYTVPASTTVKLTGDVVARRTGGASGTAEDGAGYTIVGTYKLVAGTATLIGAVSQAYVAEDQAAWDATFTVTGATVLVRVTGAAANNVTWHLSALKAQFVSQ